MPQTKNHGACYLCNQDVEHRIIQKHLEKCIENCKDNELARKNEKEKIFLIKIFSGKEFWIYIEINGSSILENLDYFLRKTWVECCEHMSQFTINGERYKYNGKMNKVIHRVLPVGAEFNYEYDFGSTTILTGTVISSRSGELKEDLRLLARNHLPEYFQCTTCQKIPIVICTSCDDLFCEQCKNEHKNCADDDYTLPVVNSPRMGVCGYTGPYNEII